MVPSPAELAALADKYDALVVLRARRDQGGPEASRGELRDLSRHFPGSLRELDTLGGPELRRRAEATRLAAAGGPQEPWMAWISAFHRLMQAALLVKAERNRHGREQASGRTLPDDDELAERAGVRIGFRLPARLVRDVVRPPEGRLVPLIMAELARLFGVDAQLLQHGLFPRRRGDRGGVSAPPR